MPLTNLPFKPGFYSDDTDRDVGRMGYWKNGDKVRFYKGLPQKIGGWQKQNPMQSVLGVPRQAIDWQTTRLQDLISVGTSKRLYVWEGGLFYDVTPVRATATLTDPFTTTIGSAVVTVDDFAHGAIEGAPVIFSGASAVGGITINGEYTITSVVTADQYTITHSSAATSSAGPGGGSVSTTYLLNPGLTDSVINLGFGLSLYGAGTYGTPRTLGQVAHAQQWSLDTWGEDLIAGFRDGNIYVWDSSVGIATRAALISGAPTNNKAVFVSQEDRHLVVLGAGGDPMQIKWSDTEDYTDFVATTTNTAGDKRLDQGNQILTAVKLRGEHLIFTDAAAFSMTFSGPPDTFSFRPLGSDYGLVGPQAAIEYEGKAYWMGARGFYVHDGVTRVMDCPVLTTVFDNFNDLQRFKTYAGVNQKYNEVWWLYPSENSSDVDRYVLYNTVENTWAFGTLARTILIADSDIFAVPYGFDASGFMYSHETGVDDDAMPLASSLESGDIEVDADGNQFMHVSKAIPDFKTISGNVKMTVTGKRYPQDSETQASGPHTITSSTKFVNPRMRCRQVSIKIETTELGADWRMGVPRLELLPHGRR